VTVWSALSSFPTLLPRRPVAAVLLRVVFTPALLAMRRWRPLVLSSTERGAHRHVLAVGGRRGVH
jgi:hypothetical protein